MVFPDYWSIWQLTLAVFLLCVAVWLWRLMTKQRWFPQIIGRLTAIGVGASASIFLLLMGGCEVWNTHESVAVYSPNGQEAILLRTTDSGALGGYTIATLYSAHGLWAEFVAGGEFHFVEPKDVIWTGNDHVKLLYDPSYLRKPECVNARSVQIICVPCKVNGFVC